MINEYTTLTRAHTHIQAFINTAPHTHTNITYIHIQITTGTINTYDPNKKKQKKPHYFKKSEST